MAFESCSLSSLQVLAEQSINHSMMPPLQKLQALESLRAQWKGFLKSFAAATRPKLNGYENT